MTKETERHLHVVRHNIDKVQRQQPYLRFIIRYLTIADFFPNPTLSNLVT